MQKALESTFEDDLYFQIPKVAKEQKLSVHNIWTGNERYCNLQQKILT